MGRLCAMILAAGMVVAAAGVEANNTPARVQSQSTTNVSKRHHFTIGLASWYGRFFQGRQTANGERFNMNELTAASKTLPLGSYAKVTNLQNRRWVLVRVNDRGPMVPGRIIDLSYRAASVLNLTEKGVQRVKVEPIENNEPTEAVAMLNHSDDMP